MTTAIYKSTSQIISAMNRVYGHMALAVITSMIVSFLVSSSPALMGFFFTGAMKWIVIFAPLVAIFAISFNMQGKLWHGATDAARFCGTHGAEFCHNLCCVHTGQYLYSLYGGSGAVRYHESVWVCNQEGPNINGTVYVCWIDCNHHCQHHQYLYW